MSRESTSLRKPISLRDFREVFRRSRNGKENVFIWDGSKNPFGTWKDIKAEYIAERVRRESIDTVVCITAGNAGYAIGRFLAESGTNVVLIVDQKTSVFIKKELHRVTPYVVETDLSKKLGSEDVMKIGKKYSRGGKVWDVTAGCEEAYERLVTEIRHVHPELIVCPIGQGEGFMGLVNGVRKQKLQTRVIGVAPLCEHRSIANKLASIHLTPYLTQMAQATLNGQAALVSVPEQIIWNNYQAVKRNVNNMPCEPSSAIVFAAALWLREKPWCDKRAVFLNSGKGLE